MTGRFAPHPLPSSELLLLGPRSVRRQPSCPSGAAAVYGHHSPGNTAVHAAGCSGETVPACADLRGDRAIDCCDETIAEVAGQVKAPRSNLTLTLAACPLGGLRIVSRPTTARSGSLLLNRHIPARIRRS